MNEESTIGERSPSHLQKRWYCPQSCVAEAPPSTDPVVINTHTHFDHVGSNIALTGMVEFVAQENCKASMEKMAAFQSDEGKRFLPGKTYKDKLSLLKGNDTIDLYYFGRGHADSDTFLVFPALRVMHGGGTGANPMMPLTPNIWSVPIP